MANDGQMTVGELIAKLQEYDPTALVGIADNDYDHDGQYGIPNIFNEHSEYNRPDRVVIGVTRYYHELIGWWTDDEVGI